MRSRVLGTVAIFVLFLQWLPAEAASLRLAYTGQLMGELEPCGCTKDSDLGGIRRLASVVDELREADADLVLVSTGGLLGITQPAHPVTNRFILRGVAALKYDAIGLQRHDLVYGSGALKVDSLPWVSTNLPSEAFDQTQPSYFAPERLFRRGSIRLGFLFWSAPNTLYHHKPAGSTPGRREPGALERRLQALKAESVVTIVGTDNAAQALEELPLGLIDVLLLPAANEEYGEPEKLGTTWILRAGRRGQRLGYLILNSNDAGGWALTSHEVIALTAAVPDARRLDDWYQQYEAALVQDYRDREQLAKETQAQGTYAGDKRCGLCHSKQMAQWQTTDHADAYQSLVGVSKQFDANCIGCHVVGFGLPGGFSSASQEPDLRNVGCEACHGAAGAHQRSGGTKPLEPVSLTGCTKCHTRQHSPNFDPVDYWAKIIHRPAGD